jgi:hypothetical protein
MSALFLELWSLLKKPRYRALFVWMFIILLLGTVFYRLEEDWSWLDSLYFSVITLSTVGYGDLSPTTSASKLFTLFYILLGISVFVSFASMLAKEHLTVHAPRIKKKQKVSDK